MGRRPWGHIHHSPSLTLRAIVGCRRAPALEAAALCTQICRSERARAHSPGFGMFIWTKNGSKVNVCCVWAISNANACCLSPQTRHGKRACAVDQRCSLGLGSARSALGMPKRPGAACTPLWSARSQEFVHLTPPHTWVYHIYNNTSAGSSTALSCETRKKVSTVPLSLCHARTVAHEGTFLTHSTGRIRMHKGRENG